MGFSSIYLGVIIHLNEYISTFTKYSARSVNKVNQIVEHGQARPSSIASQNNAGLLCLHT